MNSKTNNRYRRIRQSEVEAISADEAYEARFDHGKPRLPGWLEDADLLGSLTFSTEPKCIRIKQRVGYSLAYMGDTIVWDFQGNIDVYHGPEFEATYEPVTEQETLGECGYVGCSLDAALIIYGRNAVDDDVHSCEDHVGLLLGWREGEPALTQWTVMAIDAERG